MSLHPVRIYRLDWDPSKTKTEEGEASRFEWAIDHEFQKREDWCWAACLRNALTSIGRYMTKEEIREGFFRSKGWSLDLEPKKDERIPTPEDAAALWHLFGYRQVEPSWVNQPLSFDDLAKEIATHGPVQIELWREDAPGDRHLALIYGVRETKTGLKQVCVSNPAQMGTDSPRPYNQMKEANPLGGTHGEWHRTYLNHGNDKGLPYLRRFFGCPTRYLGRLDIQEDIGPDGTPTPKVDPVPSQLWLEPLPKPLRLNKELALASYGYRHFQYRDASEKERKRREAELRQSLFLRESIRVWRPPAVLDYKKDLREQLQPGRWHHQISNSKEPCYYAHTRYFKDLQKRVGSGWRTVWMGERWAKPVDSALRKLETNYGERDEEVRLVWFEREELVTLHLAQSNIHLVASSGHQKILPPLDTFTDEKLREILREL